MGKTRLIDANALFDAPPEEMKIFVASPRPLGKTLAIYEQLFRKRVDAAPTVNARPVTKVRAVVAVDWAHMMPSKDVDRIVKEQIAYKLGELLIEEGFAQITRKEDLRALGRSEFEATVFVGYDELP